MFGVRLLSILNFNSFAFAESLKKNLSELTNKIKGASGAICFYR